MILAALAVTAAMLNPSVTQADIKTTICKAHWAAVYRVTHPRPVPTKPGMIVDHNVSIELGGASTVANMRYQTVANGHAKDVLERALNRKVCRGQMPLADAQAAVVAYADK